MLQNKNFRLRLPIATYCIDKQIEAQYYVRR